MTQKDKTKITEIANYITEDADTLKWVISNANRYRNGDYPTHAQHVENVKMYCDELYKSVRQLEQMIESGFDE